MNLPRPLLIGGAAALTGISVLALTPGCREDPRELAPGNWVESGRLLQADVSPDGSIRWQIGGSSGTLRYEWVDTENEPYQLTLTHRKKSIPARLTFEDSDTAVIEPQIWDKLSPAVRRDIARQNKANRRPENEIRLRFHRRREKKD